MLEFFQVYPIGEIIIFTIMLAIAIRGFISFWDWAVERVRKVFNKESRQEQQVDDFKNHLEKHDKILEKLAENQDVMHEEMQQMSDKMTLLLDSDRDSIKSYITEKHHNFCYDVGWIDDYSLDCLEKRYSHYVAEDGNSYIADLMREIRNLPKTPPQN